MKLDRKIDTNQGLFIYKLIEDSGETIKSISDKAGIERRTMNYYCSGERNPSFKATCKILKAIGALNIDIPF